MPYCYNIQNTDKRYLFPLFLDKNKNVRKIDILLYRIQRIKDKSKKSFSWYFVGVCIINRILHARLWIRILSSRVQLEDKIRIHKRACDILYVYLT